MKEFYGVILRFIAPYKLLAVMNIVYNLFGVIFSLFSITLIIPFLGILFNTQPLVTETVPFAMDIDSLTHNFYYLLSNLIIEQGKTSALAFVCFSVASMFFLKNVFIFLANHQMADLRTRIVRDIRRIIYDRLIILPLGFFTETRKGDVITRITSDVQIVESSVISSIQMAFRHPLNILFFMVTLFVMSFKLTLFILVLLPLSAFAISKIAGGLKRTSRLSQEQLSELMSIVDETITGMRVIKAFNAQAKMKDVFARQNEMFRKTTRGMYKRHYLASPLSEFMGITVMVVVMWFGGVMVLQNGSIEPQSFIAYLAIFSQIITPAKALTTSYYDIVKGMSAMERIDELLAEEEKIVEKSNAIPVKDFNRSIRFENVSFKYQNEWVLKDINLTIEKGKSIAFVGQSGSGKSTLVDLIPRFHDIQEGRIFIDDVEIRDLKILDLRSLMGNVNQNPILFNGSLSENIAFGIEAEQADIEAAAKVANAHEFIIEAEQGYQTNIGDRGDRLSGGQRQRISIARAVLRNPPIMILDEATSALDTESERLVQEALLKLMRNRTSIVIAHRLSTIKHADIIHVMHRGQIVESGTHEELIRVGKYYKRLHEMQMF